MISRVNKNKKSLLIELLGPGHRVILDKTVELESVLTKLIYEGKVMQGRNVKEWKRVMKFFAGPFKKHLEVETEVIYPFLTTYVPKLEEPVRLLISQHHEIQEKLRQLEELSGTGMKAPHQPRLKQWLTGLESIGTYFVHSLRHHLKAETEIVFKAAAQVLTMDELQVLGEKIEVFRKERESLKNTK